MIIQCQECRTKFNLDDTLLKDEGSEVRCSVCRHLFKVYPPREVLAEQVHVVAGGHEELAKSIDEDLPPATYEEAIGSEQKEEEIDLDKIFEDSLVDLERSEAGVREDLYEPEREEGPREEELLHDAPVEKDISPGKAETIAALRHDERPGRSHFLSVFLVVILLLVGGAAAIIFWAPELIPDSLSILRPAKKQQVTEVGVRLLSFKGVNGSFVDSKGAGHLFVIRGLVKNKYPRSRSFILVKGTILDDKGKVVKQKLAYAGNTLKLEEIKVLPMAEINKAMENRFGEDRINLNVAPGSTLPFMIVFENLPDNLSEFTVEAVSSSPVR